MNIWNFLKIEFKNIDNKYVDDYFLKKNKKIKEDLKFLKNKNYFYYDYWFIIFKKKKKKIKPVYKFLEYLLPVTINKVVSLSDSIFYFFENFYIFLKKKNKLNFHNIKNNNLLIYYSYNIGFNLSSETNLNFYPITQKHILTLDFRFKKFKTYYMYGGKLLFNITPGLVLKILELKEKNLKKSQRVINTVLKTSFKKINEYNHNNIVVDIKGVKSYSNKIFNLLNTYDLDMFILWNPSIRKNNLRFKKIKAIKKNILKKNKNLLN